MRNKKHTILCVFIILNCRIYTKLNHKKKSICNQKTKALIIWSCWWRILSIAWRTRQTRYLYTCICAFFFCVCVYMSIREEIACGYSFFFRCCCCCDLFAVDLLRTSAKTNKYSNILRIIMQCIHKDQHMHKPNREDILIGINYEKLLGISVVAGRFVHQK